MGALALSFSVSKAYFQAKQRQADDKLTESQCKSFTTGVSSGMFTNKITLGKLY